MIINNNNKNFKDANCIFLSFEIFGYCITSNTNFNDTNMFEMFQTFTNHALTLFLAV